MSAAQANGIRNRRSAAFAAPPHKTRKRGGLKNQTPRSPAARAPLIRGAEIEHRYFFVPKSTVGGLATAFSSSTVNCAFGLWPKTIAVRLTGNWRTVVLYSCVDFM
jgi:hypothetical protein